MSQPIIAIDLGSTKIACAIGLPHERTAGFELLGTGLVPYPKLTEAWLGDPVMVGQTLEQALAVSGVSADCSHVLVAMTHPSLRSERTTVGVDLADEPVTIRAQDVDRAKTAALHQVLGIDREPLLVEALDFAGNGFEGMRNPVGLPATRLLATFHIISIPISIRRALVQSVEAAGYEIRLLTHSLPALLAAVTEDEVARGRVLVIDVGGSTTNLGLFVDGILHRAQMVPSGGLSLAMMIARELKVTLEQATTWSLEGVTGPNPEVTTRIQRAWDALGEGIRALCNGEPLPDLALIGGRGALTDGFAEWIERVTKIRSRLCRSPHASRLGDLSRQVGLSAAIGLLEIATRHDPTMVGPSPRVLDRVIARTRAILTEYF